MASCRASVGAAKSMLYSWSVGRFGGRGAGMAFRKMSAACGLTLAATLGACAHGGSVAVAEPGPPQKPANERTRLYAACARASDAEPQRFGRYVRLTCKGEPAHAPLRRGADLQRFARAGNDGGRAHDPAAWRRSLVRRLHP